METDKLERIKEKIKNDLGIEGMSENNAKEAIFALKTLFADSKANQKLLELKKLTEETNKILINNKYLDNSNNQKLTEGFNKIFEKLDELKTVKVENFPEIKIPDRADDIVKAIKENKVEVNEVEVKGLEKLIPKEGEIPQSVSMELKNDYWKTVNINYLKKTVTVNIERNTNNIIKRLTFAVNNK